MLSMTTTASMAYTSSEISTVSDEQLLKEIVDKDTDVVYSGDKTGGTKNKTQKCGRVTAYMKCWYTNKSFNKSNGVKLTKTGGKITQKENAGLVIRKLKSTYTGKGTCWNSSGKTLSAQLIPVVKLIQQGLIHHCNPGIQVPLIDITIREDLDCFKLDFT